VAVDMSLGLRCPLDNMFRICSYGRERTKYEHKRGIRTMSATAYLKEASALVGLFVTLYLWSLVGFALQG